MITQEWDNAKDLLDKIDEELSNLRLAVSLEIRMQHIANVMDLLDSLMFELDINHRFIRILRGKK